MRSKFIRTLWKIFFGIFAFIALGIFGIEMGWIGNMPDLDELQSPISRYASQIYSADGKMLGTWSRNENRVFVDYDSISPYVFKALVATEDERFFDHSGIDAKALGRAIIKRGFMGQKNAGGGSTITQQLAKQLYSETATSTTQRLLQKPIEWVIAVELERNFTKEEILTLYLNYFDFLHNAVGIKTAARVYFSKAPKNLSINEAALLIGMCKNPSYFNPVREPERCKERRNVVLQQMVKAGYLSQAKYEELRTEELKLKFHQIDHKEGQATYLREYLRQIMMADEPVKEKYHEWQKQQFYADSLAWAKDPLYGWCKKNHKRDGSTYDIYTDGLKIYTTIDTRMQHVAEQCVYDHVAKHLQPIFNSQKTSSSNFPFSSNLSAGQVEKILWRAARQSDRYRVMKAAGASEEDIKKAFTTPVNMTVFTYNGDTETRMTPMDSIKYYKAFLRSGLVSIDPSNGYVKAYVGGLDYVHFQYDMAMQGRRQIGSTMKPFVYAMAMEDGFTPDDVVANVQKTYGNWTPRNGSRARYGSMVPLRWGLQHSNNWVTAGLMHQIDPSGQRLKHYLGEYGVANGDICPSMALCLGTCDISVGEMASAYTTFVNKGLRCAPILVTRIEDSEGNVVAEFQPRMNEVISEQSSYYMIEMMRGVIDGGTGSRLRGMGLTGEIAGKTGTTNDNSDGWFVGYVPNLVTACWVGGENRDIHFNNTAIGQGAASALPIWGNYMLKLYDIPNLGYSQDLKFDMGEKNKVEEAPRKRRSIGSTEGPGVQAAPPVESEPSSSSSQEPLD